MLSGQSRNTLTIVDRVYRPSPIVLEFPFVIDKEEFMKFVGVTAESATELLYRIRNERNMQCMLDSSVVSHLTYTSKWKVRRHRKTSGQRNTNIITKTAIPFNKYFRILQASLTYVFHFLG